MSKEYWEEQFEIRGNDPYVWLDYALGFRYTAEVLLDHLGSTHLNQPPGLRPVDTRGVVMSIMLLLGLAIENAIKGIDVAKKGDLTDRKKLNTSLWKSHKGHGIGVFIRSILPISSAEAELVDRLQEHILWAGRYPIPIESTKYYAAKHPNHKMKFSTGDVDVALGLFQRLEQELQNAAGGKDYGGRSWSSPASIWRR